MAIVSDTNRTQRFLKWVCVGILLSVVFALPQTSGAQTNDSKTYNIAQTLIIDDPDAVDGDIMTLTDKDETITRSSVSYDERMHGVLVATPVMVYRTSDAIPVTRSGNVFVNVTTLAGPIKPGDYVTSSEITGKGMKATELTGYMVGVALTSFDGTGGQSITHDGQSLTLGRVKVAVGIGPASPAIIRATGGIMGTLRQIITAFIYNIRTSKQFERIIRYIIAALVAIATIYINFRTFGRNVTKGIEAIGRNPLAKVPIQSMIIVNVALIGVVSIGGILLALAILSL